jgi:predicted TIM-barrel fold metal-dependent hydrolase
MAPHVVEVVVNVIDAQVHVYERNRPSHPWAGAQMHGPPEVTGSDMVAAMAEAGVDAAIIVSPWSIYRWDASYAISVAESRPDLFRVVAPVDAMAADVQDRVDQLAAEPMVIGFRLMMLTEQDERHARDGRFARFFDAVSARGLPLCTLSPDMGLLSALAARHPDLQFVIDHMGVRQPISRTITISPFEITESSSGARRPAPPTREAAFAGIDGLLALAGHDNIAVKISGVPTLSQVPFPYADVWPHIHAVLNAFGTGRCIWGTDWTRALDFSSYEQGLAYVKDSDQLSADEKDALLGGTLSCIYRWNL